MTSLVGNTESRFSHNAAQLLFQIRVNSVNPMLTLTPLAIKHGWDNPEKAKRVLDIVPLGRLAGMKIVFIKHAFNVQTKKVHIHLRSLINTIDAHSTGSLTVA